MNEPIPRWLKCLEILAGIFTLLFVLGILYIYSIFLFLENA